MSENDIYARYKLMISLSQDFLLHFLAFNDGDLANYLCFFLSVKLNQDHYN